MPAIITHYSFALEVAQSGVAIASKKAFLLGAQGPDPFFFYGMLPWKKRKHSKEITHFGSDFHHIDITEPYLFMMEYASHSAHKELLYSYIYGLLCHYVLDREEHPYIFVKSGFSDDPVLAKLYASSHTCFETILDMKVGEEHHTFTTQSYRYLNIDDGDLALISEMWSQTNNCSLRNPYIVSSSFYEATRDYARILRFINSPHGLKRCFIGTFIGKKSLPFVLNYPLHLSKKYTSLDYFNEAHAVWPDLVSGKPRKESFKDLWNQAQYDYKVLSGLFLEKSKGQNVVKMVRDFVNNINHDGLHPLDHKNYMAVIWPKQYVKTKE